MKRIVAVLFVITLAFTMISGCAKGGGITVEPSKIDWTKTSQFYHEYIAGMVAPVGAGVARAFVPEAAPLISLAVAEVGKLDALIAGKAAGADISTQAQVVQDAITKANAVVGGDVEKVNEGK